MADVFISYRSDDRGAVGDIVAGLTAEGIDVWWDQGIAPSAEWRAEIHRQLRIAKVVVAVWSRNSTDLETGKWVVQEAEDADGRGVLVPVVIDDVLPPLGLRHVQAADLVDWRGDRNDPRWRGFLETVRAKRDGRAVDARIARDTGPATAGAALQGRSALLLLAVGLAALTVTTAIAFGPVTAGALVGGLVLGYLVMNLLFSRRRNDRAAATFLRRAFAVGWVTTLANVVVWGGAIAAGAYPYAKPLLYPEFSIAVFDELQAPVPDAQVSVELGGHQIRVALGADGVGRISYPLRWGPQTGTVLVRRDDYELARPIARVNGRFGDLSLGVPSGQQRLRVSHVTLEDLAIDAVHQGRTPPEIAAAFPKIVGVVRNAVWEETDRYLANYRVVDPNATVSELALGADGADQPSTQLYGGDINQDWHRSLRWVQELVARTPYDFSSGVMGCPVDQALDTSFRLFVGDTDGFYRSNRLGLTPEAQAALAPLGLESAMDEQGQIAARLFKLVDAAWLTQFLQEREGVIRTDAGDALPEATAYAGYLTRLGVPAGVVTAELDLAAHPGCELQFAAVDLTFPAASLRVSIVENVSDVALPIEAVVQGMAGGPGLRVWAEGGSSDRSAETPWALGVLQPGEAIAVPRRLMLPGTLTREEVTAITNRPPGPPIGFEVFSASAQAEEAAGEEGALGPSTPSDEAFLNTLQARMSSGFARSAQRFTIGAGQVARDPVTDETPPPAVRYAIGPTVEALAVRIGGIEFGLREDAGRTLAIVAGFEFGSCPFVFASLPGQQTMLNRGAVITDQVGPEREAADRVYLGQAVGRVEIRELEPERSVLNRVRLVVEGADRTTRTYAPAAPALAGTDGLRVTLEQGDRLALSFPGYVPRHDDRAVFLEAVGYYTPLPASHRDMSRLRLAGIRR
ncbi:MAG: toll/interleukin-1 receptor domain-containing protein [Caulobacterales bacterium]